MPIYEYKCNKCGVFEVMQKITEAPLKKCPTCKGKTERLISSTSFVLKGSGWYATDYAKKSTSKPEASESATTSNSTNGSAPKDSASSSSSTPSSDSSSKPAAEKPASAKTD
jgi:putative FmdB family regulatory protein